MKLFHALNYVRRLRSVLFILYRLSDKFYENCVIVNELYVSEMLAIHKVGDNRREKIGSDFPVRSQTRWTRFRHCIYTF
jgi:hypothetical protein